MNPDGKTTLAALGEVRRFFGEISKMLLAADAMMRDAGWEQRNGSTATAGNAFSIHSPQYWMPSKLFRFYRCDASNLLIPCVSVILGSDEKNLDEPLVCGAVVEYETNNLPVGTQLYGISTWHLWVPDRKDDGSTNCIEPRALWPTETGAKKMTSFALPLMVIKESSSLRELVIEPVLKVLAAQAGIRTHL